jgi:RsiW-degrading membrane proteinase PrsW (M82 family)
VFNTHFPVSFIIQFAVQFIVLLSFILADYKVFRYTASILVMTFPVFMFLNGLFKINPQYSNFESTIVEARKLADDVWEFNTELTERISRVNSDMTVALDQIVERQKQIERISALLESKQQEYEKLSSVVELDTKRAEEIFEALNYHPTTVWDTLISGFIGGIISLALTIIYTFFARRMGWRTL